MHTLNEEANLPFVLATLRWCDEIVVVDMDSDDHTAEIARGFTDRVVSHPRTGYVEPARAFGVEQCAGEWVLIVDADELISPPLARTLRGLSLRADLDVVWLPRKNLAYGRWLRHGTAWPDAFPRFFRKGKLDFSDKIHSKPRSAAGARSLTLAARDDNAILHLPAQSVGANVRKNLGYAEVQARAAAASGRRFSLAGAVARVARAFGGRLLYKRGFQDGGAGWAAAAIDGLLYQLSIELMSWEKSSGVDFEQRREDARAEVVRAWDKD